MLTSTTAPVNSLDDLCCLECSSPLSVGDGELNCQGCGASYPILRGTPRLLRPELRQSLLPESGPGASGALATGADATTKAKLRTAASFGFEWQRFHHLREEWEANFLGYMQPHGPEFFRGKRVLDAGCGTGRHAYFAALAGADVTGVDLSDAIDVARRNTEPTGRVRTIQADLYDLPFPPESFDVVYSLGVLHHLPDPEGAFRNILRYLKPGGEARIYLYWWPEGQPVKSALLHVVTALRTLTTRLPHGLLYWLSYPLAAAAFAGFVLPYRVLRRLPGCGRWAEGMPMRQYASYPFPVCVNDQFDRFSAPLENRYTQAEVHGWLERAGLEDVQVLPNWGWLGVGKKPAAESHAAPHRSEGETDDTSPSV